MKYALDAEMSKEVDRFTIKDMGVPGTVLMERAAVCVAEKTAEIAALFSRNVKIAVVAGSGNNGADGIAAARILTWQGVNVDIIAVGDESRKTEEYVLQEKIALNSGLNFVNQSLIPEYDIIIDGIFGVGLSRKVEGKYAEIISLINNCKNVVVSIDVPSGIDASTGQVLGIAIKADATVTFGYHKTGLLVYPGKEYAGEITVSDIGFCPEAIKTLNPAMYFTGEDIKRIPARIPDSNKGTYGRILVIAGSEDMSGAAYLSGLAAFKTGAGLVEILTHKKNTEVIRKLLPEAIVKGYDEGSADMVLEECMERATCIILGPGLSTGELAKKITDIVFANGKVPLIADADAINIIANDISVLKSYSSTVIITPHIGEMVRISGMSKEEILSDSIGIARKFAVRNNVILVLKNAVTIIAEPGEHGRTYINTSGTGAMSKAGMGDVLTGIIAGMLALRIEPFSAAAMGVYLHGIAGEMAAESEGEHSVMASDAAICVGRIMNN